MKAQTLPVRNKGFALIVTLSLMILLTVIAVGLLSLSSISLRAAGQGEAMATAKANARLALMLALGDLQKTLGPDRAITATSEILGTATAAPTKPNLTGVWKSWDDFDPTSPGTSAADYYLARKKDIFDEPQKGKFSRWLISSSDPARPTKRNFVTNDWDEKKDGKTVELVGAGSLGTAAPASAKVTAGLVPVSRDGKTVQGSYAWHVADESVKARINTYRDPSQNTTLAQKRALLAGHRPDASVIVGADGSKLDFLPTDTTSKDFNDARVVSGKLIDLNQVELLPQATGKAKQFRNDVTPYSLGVMADVRNGGLKQDLSSIFEMSTGNAVSLPAEFAGSGASTKKLYQTTLGTAFTSGAGYADPFWSNLAGYYNSFRNITPSSLEDNPTLIPANTVASVTASKVPQTYFPGPVIAKVETVFSLVTREVASTYLGQYGPADSMNLFDDAVSLIFTPQITLHNPYNVNISFYKMVVTIVNVPVAFKFTLLPGGVGAQSQSVTPSSFESLSEFTQERANAGDKKFVVNIANWKKESPADLEIDGPIVMKPGQTLICTPFLDPAGNFLKDSRSGAINDVFDWQNKLTSIGIKAKPVFTAGLGFENNSITPSARSSSTLTGGPTNWWMFMLRDPLRLRTPKQESPKMDDTQPSPGHPTDKYFVEFQAQQPKFTDNSGTRDVASNFQVSATLQSTSASAAINYANLKFDYTNDIKLKSFFKSRVYRYPTDPDDYLTGEETFVSATTSIANQAKVRPFAVFSAYMRTTNGGVYETGSRAKSGADSSQVNLLKDGRLAGKPFLFHNPSRSVLSMNFASDLPGSQPYEINFQPLDGIGGYQDYLGVSTDPVTGFPRVNALTANTTTRGIKSGSYLEIPTGPMQTIADFRRSNALSSSYLPHFVQPVGNSLLHPLMSSDKVIERNLSISPDIMLDQSVLANHAFYDRFYFSTFATRGVEKPDTVFEKFMKGLAPLPSHSFQPYLPSGSTAATAKAELFSSGKPNNTAYKLAAEYQMVRGPFNVNSTSVQAWKAELASMNNSQVSSLWAVNNSLSSKATGKTPILGMSLPNGGLIGGTIDSTKIDNVKTNEWNGYVELDDLQLSNLAIKIVDQVRLRGPFLSMSEFVNRQIGSESELSLTGPLEKAIIDSNINTNFMAGQITTLNKEDFSDSTLYNYKTPNATVGNPAAGAPGWVSQGDLLRILEPTATVRSDTFIIRVCGQAQDANGNVTARAYAEAVVQRTPEYVDPLDRPSFNVYNSSTATVNKTFGRRMNWVSFRWLSSNEI